MFKLHVLGAVGLLALAAGCGDRSQTPAPADSLATTSPVAPLPPSDAPLVETDSWLGQWNGPEGTFVSLAKSGDRYAIRIQSLDGPDTYEGVSDGSRIDFVRNGKPESLRAGSGRDTGMKWLLEKNDCLIINEGEGFCRD